MNEQDHQGLAALHWAVLGRPRGDDDRHIACVKLLLENGADTELFSLKGWVPLHYACGSGDVEGVRCLLEAKANIEVQDPMGQTPMHRAAIAKQPECLRLLLQDERCNNETVDIKDDMGRTVMHWACLHNQREMVVMCIKKEINIGITDKSGRLAEDLAMQKGHRELVAWLNEGAFPKSENPHLMRAAAHVKRNHREWKTNDLLETMKTAGLEEDATTVEGVRDVVLETTMIHPASIPAPAIEDDTEEGVKMTIPKPDLKEDAEKLREIVTKLNDMEEESETLSPETKKHIVKELTELAEDLAPAAI